MMQIDKNITKYAKETYIYKTSCPYCNKGTLIINEIIYNVPGLEDVLLVSKRCTSCGYKHTNLLPLKKKRHTRIYIKVSREKDLKTKILRSNTSTIEIPEIGAELSPGLIASTFITNIEGILQRFLDALSTMKILDISGESEKVIEVKKKIEQMARGKIPFTVIIDDPLGISSLYEYSKDTTVIIEYLE